MDLIPAMVRKLYDVWDVRMLVLLSLTLQIILFIFGKRRKYISSLWITVVIWSAYVLADWVATVALGKLSDASDHEDDSNNKTNKALQAIWAPLLLIHLGGPDTITAFSLEDNTLWLRHLMGLVVQVVVAVYVILMSWGNSSWLSFLSLPALVAGIVKYGERIWTLKSACEDESGNFVPFNNNILGGDHKTSSSRGRGDESGNCTREPLILAHKLVKKFKQYMENYDLDRFKFEIKERLRSGDENYFLEAVEVEMGLMYDLMYTKATVIYSKAGLILRSISLACTLSMLIGFVFWLITALKHKDMAKVLVVNVAITGILLVGALALEIYAIIVILSSDWITLWLLLINSDHERQNSKGCFKSLIRLGKKYFTNNNKKKKYWSKTMGQFDLLSFFKKEDHKQLAARTFSRILGLMLGNENMHKTCVPIPSQLCNKVLEKLHSLSSMSSECETEILPLWGPFDQQILIVYLATEILCYDGDDSQDNSGCASTSSGSGDDNKTTRERCKILSRYLMYLLLTFPSLSSAQFRKFIKSLKMLINKDDSDAHVTDKGKVIELMNMIDRGAGDNAVTEGVSSITNIVNESKSWKWKILENMWLGMLVHAATTRGHKNDHLQQLRQGGELLTFLWFLIPQSDILRYIHTGMVGYYLTMGNRRLSRQNLNN